MCKPKFSGTIPAVEWSRMQYVKEKNGDPWGHAWRWELHWDTPESAGSVVLFFGPEEPLYWLFCLFACFFFVCLGFFFSSLTILIIHYLLINELLTWLFIHYNIQELYFGYRCKQWTSWLFAYTCISIHMVCWMFPSWPNSSQLLRAEHRF